MFVPCITERGVFYYNVTKKFSPVPDRRSALCPYITLLPLGQTLTGIDKKSPSVAERLGCADGWSLLSGECDESAYFVAPIVFIPRYVVEGVDTDFYFPVHAVGLPAMGAGEKVGAVHRSVLFRSAGVECHVAS